MSDYHLKDAAGRAIVRCRENCGAYLSPQTPEETKKTLEHWLEHRVPSHADVAAGRWRDGEGFVDDSRAP